MAVNCRRHCDHYAATQLPLLLLLYNGHVVLFDMFARATMTLLHLTVLAVKLILNVGDVLVRFLAVLVLLDDNACFVHIVMADG